MGAQKGWPGNSGRLPGGEDWDEWGGLVGAKMRELVSGYRAAVSRHRWILGGLDRAYGKR